MGFFFDNEALKLLRGKDSDALKAWFERFVDNVYTFVYYRVGKDEQVACDVVQETFLEALTKIERYDPKKGSMEVWLTTLSRNFISKALKAQGMLSLDQFGSNIDKKLLACFERLATEPLPQDILEKKETHDLVCATLATIPGNYRTILTLYYHRGLSLRDIALKANKSEGAVKVLLHRARQAFKEAFLQLGDSGLCQGGQS
ncbi:MAG: RNA polymerase sigma factor [Planctomycetota bacterium]|jgi:RNA polymerase sigma-70 factor (ECF subfamily)